MGEFWEPPNRAEWSSYDRHGALFSLPFGLRVRSADHAVG